MLLPVGHGADLSVVPVGVVESGPAWGLQAGEDPVDWLVRHAEGVVGGAGR